MEFIENISETQNNYDLELKEKNGVIILEAKQDTKLISTRCTKLSIKGSVYVKDKDDNNIHIIYNNNKKLRELHVYTFDLQSKKIQRCKLDFLDIIIKSPESNKIKNKVIEWIDDLLDTKLLKSIQQDNINLIEVIFENLLNNKYYFILYGRKFLKSAIEHNNIELMDVIFKKTIQYLKKIKSHFQ